MSDLPRPSQKLTTEFLAYLAIFVVAVALRFLLLGKLPLDDHEATLALQALRLSQGEPVLLSGEPGYIALTAALFFVTDATEFNARFWPALAGSLLVLTPLFFRANLGKPAALILAALIAIDPILIGISRSAEGSALAILGLLAALGFGLRKHHLMCGISLGLGLAGGVGIWPGMILLGLLYLLNRKKIGSMDGHSLAKLAVTAGITLLALSTMLLTNPRGISSLGSSIVDYARSWSSTDGAPFVGVSAAWILSTLPLVIFALWALIEGLLGGDERARWLGIAAGAAIVLALANPARQLYDLFWVSIPLLSLVALKLAYLFTDLKVENRIVFLAEVGLVIALVAFSFLNTTNLVNNPPLNQEEYRNRIIGIILPLILLLGMTVLLAWGWSGTATRRGLIAGAGILAAIFMLSNSWKAASLGSRSEFEVRKNGGVPTGQEELLDTLKELSLARTGIENRIDIQVISLTWPSLEWALRDFEQVQYGSSLNPGLVPSIALTAAEREITAGASYRGQKLLWQIKPDLKMMNLSDWLRWALFRNAPVQKTELILWARNDLFPGGAIP